MEISVLEYITIAIIATFTGSVPFGPVNLTVVSITVNKSIKQAMNFAFAAAIIEIALAVSAIYFGKYIEHFFKSNTWIQIFIFSVFIFLGIFNLVKKTHLKKSSGSNLKVSEFIKGLVVSSINPQVIIFWIFAITFITQQFQPSFSITNLVIFLVGVFTTKLLVLYSFSKLSHFLKDRLKKSSNLLSRIMGTVLLIIGLIQAYKYFFI